MNDRLAPLPTTDPSIDELSRVADRSVLALALRDVPERQRTALGLHHFAGLSAPEVAERFDVSTNAAHQLLFRAHRGMRGAIERAGAFVALLFPWRRDARTRHGLLRLRMQESATGLPVPSALEAVAAAVVAVALLGVAPALSPAEAEDEGQGLLPAEPTEESVDDQSHPSPPTDHGPQPVAPEDPAAAEPSLERSADPPVAVTVTPDPAVEEAPVDDLAVEVDAGTDDDRISARRELRGRVDTEHVPEESSRFDGHDDVWLTCEGPVSEKACDTVDSMP